MLQPADVFFWFAPTWHIFWSLKWTKWFFLKTNVFQIWAENFVARNKKSQNFFSMESWTSSTSHIIGMGLSLTDRYLWGPYVENGRFLSFQNSAGVLVQPWNRIYVKIWSASDMFKNTLLSEPFKKLCLFWEYKKIFVKILVVQLCKNMFVQN